LNQPKAQATYRQRASPIADERERDAGDWEETENHDEVEGSLKTQIGSKAKDE